MSQKIRSTAWFVGENSFNVSHYDRIVIISPENYYIKLYLKIENYETKEELTLRFNNYEDAFMFTEKVIFKNMIDRKMYVEPSLSIPEIQAEYDKLYPNKPKKLVNKQVKKTHE